MVFSSIGFLCLYFPLVFFGYHLLPSRWKNLFLAIASITFYAWGEPRFVILMLVSVAFNFRVALTIDRAHTALRKKHILILAVALNLLLLTIFKYTAFLFQNVQTFLALSGHDLAFRLPDIALPIGISFYTFHAISYLIDIYRRNVKPNDSLVEYSLYIMLFPQLVAGPIIRYKDIHTQLRARYLGMKDLEAGIYRFVLGLSKKVLLANPLGLIADNGFDSPVSELSTSGAWLCLLAYTLQIYFDFSGYSDMAIGLARMFGFRFPENFNYPYKAQSVQDFWRRWHISLSTWFRDYVYIPLGGNRLGPARTLVNLWVVFLLTGIWHGASWNFIIWGAIHGFFLMTERILQESSLNRFMPPAWLRRIYTLLVVMSAWVFFRVEGFQDALTFMGVLLGQLGGNVVALPYSAAQWLHIGVLLTVASVLAAGAYTTVHNFAWSTTMQARVKALALDGLCRTAVALPLLALDLMMLALGQYNPFIYFRF